jgi:cytochrome c oxidase subunit II
MTGIPVLPDQASTYALKHDLIFWALTALTAFFTLLVAILVIVFTVRYRRGTRVDRSRPVHEHMKLEITWSVIPLILGLIMFYFGTSLFFEQRTPPKDAMDVFVIGKQWMWHIQHSNGIRENNTLHVPVGRPVRLIMISQDVIHAFYVPEFRMQFHVVPGRYTTSWFEATKPGRYKIFCGMYCGGKHSEMVGHVVALPPAEYARWVQRGGEPGTAMTVEQEGAQLFAQLACTNCHTGENTSRGPTLYGVYGTTRQGVRVDEAYLRQQILRPWDRLTPGYGQTMPAYEGQISEQQVLSLIAHIKTLGAGADGERREPPIEPQRGGQPAAASVSGDVRRAAQVQGVTNPRPPVSPGLGRPTLGAPDTEGYGGL